MTYGELSNNFKKYFPRGKMKQDGFGLIRGTDTVIIKELQISPEGPIIEIANVSFDTNMATVYNVNTGEKCAYYFTS